MFCVSCGKEVVASEAKFCLYCGAELLKPAEENHATEIQEEKDSVVENQPMQEQEQVPKPEQIPVEPIMKEPVNTTAAYANQSKGLDADEIVEFDLANGQCLLTNKRVYFPGRHWEYARQELKVSADDIRENSIPIEEPLSVPLDAVISTCYKEDRKDHTVRNMMLGGVGAALAIADAVKTKHFVGICYHDTQGLMKCELIYTKEVKISYMESVAFFKALYKKCNMDSSKHIR